MIPQQFGIYLADLDPVRGSEMAKTRPVVVVSPDEMNSALQTVVVCPMTSQLHPRWRTRIQVKQSSKPSEIAIDQIRTISRSRLVRKTGTISPAVVLQLRRAISELYGDG